MHTMNAKWGKMLAIRPRGQLRAVVLGTLLLNCSGVAHAAADGCEVIDLMPKFWRVVEATRHQGVARQVAEFRRVLAVDQTDLYSESGLGFKSGEDLDRAILKALARAQEDRGAVKPMERLIKRGLPSYISTFRKTFPDFKCDFAIYLMPSLGQLDGAGRIVNHGPALLLGVDRIAAEFTPATLPIFIDHELFHRYHFQTAGFSDDQGQNETIWRCLWSEGLATYVSMALNPASTLQDALFLPKDLVTRAQPVLPSLVAQLYPKLDQVDPAVFSQFFSYHQPDGGVPSRAGYYIGALAAQRIAQRQSLLSLAHMSGAMVRVRLSQVLADMAEPAPDMIRQPLPGPQT